VKKRYKIIYFEWADATSPTEKSWWTPEGALEWAEKDNYWVEQVGFLLKKTKEYILLAGHTNITFSEGEEIEQLGHLIKIPTAWIRNYKELT